MYWSDVHNLVDLVFNCLDTALMELLLRGHLGIGKEKVKPVHREG